MIDATCELGGLTLGVAPYIWTAEPSGLLSAAPVRSDDVSRPHADGEVPGADYVSGKTLTFEVACLGDYAGEAESLASDLVGVWARSRVDVDLRVRVTGSPSEYLLRGRPRGCDVSLGRPNELFGGYVAYAQCRFRATDPVRYSAVESSISIGLGDPGVGMVFPVEFPVVFGAGGGSGLGNAVNVGSADVSRWRATLNGPLVNPRLTHVDSGRFVRVVTSIPAGQTVVLDGRAKAILLGGSTPRPSWRGPGSAWFELGPGSNALRLTADAGSGVADFVWSSGWA